MIDEELKSLDNGNSMGAVIRQSGSDPDDFETFHYPSRGRNGFALIGADLNEYVSRCIKAALANGCVPVGERPGEDWLPTYAYGITDDEIARNMVAAWRALGRDPEFGELMFSWEDWIDPDAYDEWQARRAAAGH